MFTLLEVVSLVYTKLTEISKTDGLNATHLFTFIKAVDSNITNQILRPVLEDLKAVAMNKSQRNLVSIVDCMG
jgi:hypothetical protein